MATKEQKSLDPEAIQASVAEISVLARTARGEGGLPINDHQLSSDYKETILQYGGYCLDLLKDAKFAEYLFRFGDVEENQIYITPREGGKKRVVLRKNPDGQPQVYTIIEGYVDPGYYKEFERKVVARESDQDAPWKFRTIDHGSSEEYREAYRPFKQEDLLNYNLLIDFVDGLSSNLSVVKKKAMLNTVGTLDNTRVRRIIDAFKGANAQIEQELSPK